VNPSAGRANGQLPRLTSCPAQYCMGEHLVDLVGDGLHLGLRGRIGDRQVQALDAVGAQRGVVELRLQIIAEVLEPIELRAQFGRADRRVVCR